MILWYVYGPTTGRGPGPKGFRGELGGLVARGLIEMDPDGPGYILTAAGRAAVSE